MIILGGINKLTYKYVYPKFANKNDNYICPECNKDLVLKQGDIRIHHFAHKKDNNPCNYYSNPSESQIHKDAKMLLKQLLELNIDIKIIRKCNNNKCIVKEKNIKYKIPKLDKSSNVILEYKFKYNNNIKFADVAYIENDDIICLFEIYNTHKTNENDRPEPWFEIDAIDLITQMNEVNNINKLTIKCIRNKKCDKCDAKEKEDKISFYNDKLKTCQSKLGKEKYEKIITLINNNINFIYSNFFLNKENYYWIDINHPKTNDKISFNLKKGEVIYDNLNIGNKDGQGHNKGNYLLDDIINWHNSLINPFKICMSCNRVLKKEKNKYNCYNIYCELSSDFGKCSRCLNIPELKEKCNKCNKNI